MRQIVASPYRYYGNDGALKTLEQVGRIGKPLKSKHTHKQNHTIDPH